MYSIHSNVTETTFSLTPGGARVSYILELFIHSASA